MNIYFACKNLYTYSRAEQALLTIWKPELDRQCAEKGK